MARPIVDIRAVNFHGYEEVLDPYTGDVELVPYVRFEIHIKRDEFNAQWEKITVESEVE